MARISVDEKLWGYMMLDTLLKPVLDSDIGLTNDAQEIDRRNAALKALFAEKALFERCKNLNDKINQLQELMRIHEMDAYQLFSVLPLFQEIRLCMDAMCKGIAASDAALQAPDLVELKNLCSSILQEEYKPDFDWRWNQALSGLEDLHSLHYRFYLNSDLQVTHYALLSLNQKPFKARNALWQRGNTARRDMEVLAHCTSARENMHHQAEGFAANGGGIPSFSAVRSARTLFRGEVINARLPDLSRVLTAAIPSLYSKQTQTVWSMMRELGRRILLRMAAQGQRMQFWISAVTLMEKLQAAKLPWHFARIRPASERVCTALAAYHPAAALALEQPERLVYNKIDLTSQGRYFVAYRSQRRRENHLSAYSGRCAALLSAWIAGCLPNRQRSARWIRSSQPSPSKKTRAFPPASWARSFWRSAKPWQAFGAKAWCSLTSLLQGRQSANAA